MRNGERGQEPTSLAGTQRACQACAAYSDNPRRISQGLAGCSPVCTASHHRSSQWHRGRILRRIARHTPSTPVQGAADPCAPCIRGPLGKVTVGSEAHTRERISILLHQTGRSAGPQGTRVSRNWADRAVVGGCPRRRSPRDNPPCRPGGTVARTRHHAHRTAVRMRRRTPWIPVPRRSALLPDARPRGRRIAPAVHRPPWRGSGRLGLPGTGHSSCIGCRCSTTARSGPQTSSPVEARTRNLTRRAAGTLSTGCVAQCRAAG
jgi:hypothetical protein